MQSKPQNIENRIKFGIVMFIVGLVLSFVMLGIIVIWGYGLMVAELFILGIIMFSVGEFMAIYYTARVKAEKIAELVKKPPEHLEKFMDFYSNFEGTPDEKLEKEQYIVYELFKNSQSGDFTEFYKAVTEKGICKEDIKKCVKDTGMSGKLERYILSCAKSAERDKLNSGDSRSAKLYLFDTEIRDLAVLEAEKFINMDTEERK